MSKCIDRLDPKISWTNFTRFSQRYDYILTDNTDELYELAVKAVTAIENASEMGSSYYVNSSAVGLYQAAGVTTDWVYAEAGVELSYIYELPNGGT